jgi:acyl-CoA synthetase (AMP-forming)/AMP-acid ligase II
VASGLGAPVHSPLGFDATLTSLFLPLLVGQRILLIPPSSETEALLTTIQSVQNWSFIKLTPAHLEILNTLLPKEELSGKTRFLILGGDALFGSNLSLWRIGAPETRIINEYGPTETVVGCCVYEVDANTPREGAVPIGRPIANTQLYILDKFLQPLPIGVPGELHIGGAGVARGYLNRPELTAEKFISNPFSDAPNWRRSNESRLYKTGDLARYRPDGHIEYLGRIDNQVKIRGFRIELSEIEAVLVKHPDVSDAVVIAREDEPGEKRLVAYIVSDLIPTRIPYQAKCLLKYEDQMVPLQTVDICTAGALLEGDMSFEKGKEISLLLQLPGEEQTCWLKGRIAYSRRSTAGIEFKLTPQEQVLMEKGVTYELESFLNFLQYSLRDKLRQALEEKLPSYMVPSDFVLLMSLPLTPNGKIDRRALSQISVSYQLSDKTFVAPRTPDEELLAGIWASVLNVERVGVHDNLNWADIPY